jgi:hypothetical protein
MRHDQAENRAAVRTYQAEKERRANKKREVVAAPLASVKQNEAFGIVERFIDGLPPLFTLIDIFRLEYSRTPVHQPTMRRAVHRLAVQTVAYSRDELRSLLRHPSQ